MVQDISLPKCSAIYFAIAENNQIFYIGSTVNLNSRWSNHNLFQEFKKLGNVCIAWLQCDDISLLPLLENQSISAYKPLLNTRRAKGDGSGCIYWRTVTKNGKDYHEAYYQYEFWTKGDRLTKSTKYIPKRKVTQIQRLEQEKALVREILGVLGVKL
ncbi:MAG: GIY-YIG nuclease family protein [Iphinoe sp. HA4291-MV1]|jgi:excinuclease UvrABC nuclease subunit|nr:GIY-YIG nuclease family protein [Iphinoe sp. HA4291-MV1]